MSKCIKKVDHGKKKKKKFLIKYYKYKIKKK